MDSDVTFSSDKEMSPKDKEKWWATWPREPDDDAEETAIPEQEEKKVKKKDEPRFPNLPSRIPFGSLELEINGMIGRGGFGQVNSGFYDKKEVAVKITKTEGNNGGERGFVKNDGKPNQGHLKRESDIYEKLQKVDGSIDQGKLEKIDGLPIVYGYFLHEEYEFMVMQKLDEKLVDKCADNANERMIPEDVANVAIEAIKILENLHKEGYVHADVKPGNFMYKKKDGKRKLFLVDLGLAVKWKNESNHHVEYDQHPGNFRGTRAFASVHAHQGRSGPEYGSRRDDMQSLAYTLLYLHRGCLPWQHFWKSDMEDEKKKQNQSFQMCSEKMSHSPRKLSLLWPRESRKYFKEFLDNVMNLKFEDNPKYDLYRNLFEKIGGGSSSSTCIESTQAMPSGPAQIIGETPLWISTYNHQRAIKQRYHYNVPQKDEVLSRYIDKKSDEKVFISCACSNEEDLLALIKREGNSYTDQVYSILDNLDDRTWIKEKWSHDYCITALAGTNNGKLLVVMAKGTPFSDQKFENSEIFPESFLKQEWSDRNRSRIITAMTTAKNNWVVVLSQCKGSSQTIKQVVEFDLCYPMEGIYNRWRNGYRISLAAASEKQIAFVLDRISLDDTTHAEDGRSAKIETQEMILTKDFPGSRIKENWKKCFFASSLCYCPSRSYLAQNDRI